MSSRGSKARNTVAAAIAAAAFAACGDERAAEVSDEEMAVTITQENIVVVDSAVIESGPLISGSLQPERQAEIRAEVAGSVLETRAEEGEHVRRGELLARIEDTAAQDQYLSARSALRSAEQAGELARRNLERAERLEQAGAISERDLETARLEASTAESQRADAAARFAVAQKQLASTRVTAPFAGTVSERAVSGGDVVQPGAELYTIVDPSSMELRAAVPAVELSGIRIDAPVEFTVNGYPGRVFTGRITRVNPTVDQTTGQVEITAALPNTGGALVGGLFAEGRIRSLSRQTLVVPLEAVTFTGAESSVLRLKQGKVERAVVQLGMRDEQGDRVELTRGVAPGDTLLLAAVQNITPGTPVRVQALTDTRVSAQR